MLLIVVDQWRGLMLPKLGADYLKLPNLDRLCAERPAADRARLAALVDAVHAERAHGRPPRGERLHLHDR